MAIVFPHRNGENEHEEKKRRLNLSISDWHVINDDLLCLVGNREKKYTNVLLMGRITHTSKRSFNLNRVEIPI